MENEMNRPSSHTVLARLMRAENSVYRSGSGVGSDSGREVTRRTPSYDRLQEGVALLHEVRRELTGKSGKSTAQIRQALQISRAITFVEDAHALARAE